ncbi:hypothetical protein BDBG_04047 [Blastomyces gilchristii SLH14081]|uniref:DUF7357 domain-containing protein n=1 Tax=Blastomyces gilchristii (strain SLH14081) TaxID=559298 RepID=A0A179UJT3_BLAGS|nr:uncharacterized protein BDBG_04047 [Blastomyces gilchristii SLH14081]OAT08053.1 hypothetical protein BDBG_04047 [Blastomyces gilchristii SLH14081]
MRLHLVIQRHGLPTTRVLWTTSSPSSASTRANSAVSSFATVSSCTITSTRAPNAGFGSGASAAASGSGGLTIAQLLEDVNEVIPLETQVEEDSGSGGGIGGGAGQWGLEDYAVEVMGFECLHFMEVDGLLRDGDEVVIRALQLGDLMARRLTGRHQITIDGKHLIDGVPFGKPYIQKAVSSRPPITIPPRKKRRLNFGGWRVDDALARDFNLEDEDDEENDPDWKEETDGAGKELVLRAGDEDDDEDDEEDDDYEYQTESDESAVTPSEEAIMFHEKRSKELPIAKGAGSSAPTPDSKTRATRQQKQKAQADICVGERKIHGILLQKARTSCPSSLKRSLGVSFEDQRQSDSEGSTSSDAKSASDEDETSSVSSSGSISSEASSEASSSSSGSSSVSESKDINISTTSAKQQATTSLTENGPQTSVATPQPIVHPPGTGSRRTKNTNRRNKLRRRLEKLKELGILHKDANFADLRKWCEANPGPFPGMSGEEISESQVKGNDEQAEFERKRAQLLRDIAKGGVDVTPQPTKNANKLSPLESMSTTPINGANGAFGTATESSKRQSKLDVPSSQRLVFGSLGLKTPKTKEGEKALRETLSNHVRQPKPQSKLSSVEEIDKSTEAKIDSIENWEDRLILQATECLYDDVELSTPPFPFVQRWDKDAQAKIREIKGNQQASGKKRKRKSRNRQEADYYDQEWCNGDASFSNGNQLDYGNDWADEHYNSAQSLNGVGRNVTSAEATSADKSASTDDLPGLPDDMSILKDARDADMKPGTIVAFKQLDMSKATNWQPLVSKYRTAVIEDVTDGILTLRLARRDRQQPRDDHGDDDDGVTRYTMFEMPGYDEWKGEDDGFREMQFGELIEPKLLSIGSTDGSVEVVEETQHHLPIELPPPIPEVATVSSPTRHEISAMIREAGFRSGFDSDFLPPEELLFNVQDSRTYNDATIENKGVTDCASPTVQSPTFAGFVSSPPPNPSTHLRKDHQPQPAPSANRSPRGTPEKQIVTEVPSSPTWLQDPTSDPSSHKPSSHHQKLSDLSGHQLQYLEPDDALAKDSMASNKDLTTTSQHEPSIEETCIDTGLDAGIKSVDDAPMDDCAQHVQPMPLGSDAIYNSSPPLFQLDQTTIDQDESQLSLLPSAVEDSQPAAHHPGSSGSVIPNPFYEPDRNLPSVSPPMARFVSTAPPRTTTAAENSPSTSVTRRSRRKILSSPRQVSSSPRRKPQRYDDSLDLPAITEADKESTQHSEYVTNQDVSQKSSSSIVDLTISSEPESPRNSDRDFAASHGLPQGPRWVKKRIVRGRRPRRTEAPSVQTQRRGLRKRSVV